MSQKLNPPGAVNQEPLKTFDAAIIGGGFSGSALAYHLSKEALKNNAPLSCLLFEPGDLIGAGVAYDTRNSIHILNVPASKMSIDESEPDSFCSYLRSRSYDFSPNDFVPRALYQEYLAHQVLNANSRSLGQLEVRIIKDSVVYLKKLDSGEYLITTRSGAEYSASAAAIAIGNSISQKTPLQEYMPFFNSPWDQGSIVRAAKSKNILIVGSGLTAIDTILALEASGFTGSYTLISRRGQLPKPHAEHHGPPQIEPSVVTTLTSASSLKNMLAAFRSLSAKGTDWRSLIDSLRPFSSQIWRRFSLADKRRFLNLLRPYWDAHRHRAPAASLNRIQILLDSGRLTLLRGRVLSGTSEGSRISILLSSNASPSLRAFDFCFDCTGLWSDLKPGKNPLLTSILDQKLGSLDELGLGLRTADLGELIKPDKTLAHGLFTLGSLRRGDLWETTAVREIRQQAAEIARTLASRIMGTKLGSERRAVNS